MLGVGAKPGLRLGRAMVISLAVTAGFVLLFGGVGLVISAGGRFVVTAIPWVGLTIGALLTVVGLGMMTGKTKIYFGLAQRASAGINVRQNNRILSFFLFGLAYGMASLSCTLPIFLIVVVSSTTAGNFLSGFIEFVYYALGMGLVLTALTVSTALFKGVVASYLRAAMPNMERVGIMLVTLAGLFIVYYWLSIDGLGPDAWQVGWLNDIVLTAMGRVENEASSTFSVIPIYALVAGMLATVNPCGFALLPAYLSFYLAGDDSTA